MPRIIRTGYRQPRFSRIPLVQVLARAAACQHDAASLMSAEKLRECAERRRRHRIHESVATQLRQGLADFRSSSMVTVARTPSHQLRPFTYHGERLSNGYRLGRFSILICSAVPLAHQ